MAIIKHEDQPVIRGYYSKILNSKIVSSEIGAEFCTIWEQTIPVAGYIVPHYHEFEETLIFLFGKVELLLNDNRYEIEANSTVFISPNVVHSVRNVGGEPVRLIAVLMSNNPKVIYPNGTPEPVDWDNQS